jgi:hypothetical protein
MVKRRGGWIGIEMTKKKWVMGLARLDCWGLVGSVKKVQPKELESWFS